MAASDTTTLSPAEARTFLVGHHGLRRVLDPPGPKGTRALLDRLRCIQLDPLDPIGTNADLVAMARLDGLRLGDVYRHTLGAGAAFEHFSKERCLVPASRFPSYRERALQAPWWRLSARLERIPESVLDAVEAEVAARGPSTAAELADHGRVEALDWHGWRGTSKATTMALEVLWTRCRVVVCGRRGRTKVYATPHRALPEHAEAAPPDDIDRQRLLDRVDACGLLCEAAGVWWSSLKALRRGPLVDALVEGGALERVEIPGSRRSYLARAGFRDLRFPHDDGRARILGPLDPLIWDRALVREAFGFDYVWEVYKPAAKRRWGWYVCPILHEGRFAGRFEAKRTDDGTVNVLNVWHEEGGRFPDAAFRGALERHERACRPSPS